ncbi:hypothetical protein HNP46_004174 [Pseudomonas nitritireducens]|uniref:Uncharacterized protein n=1 Tax=Pseudomonas nitroreducens TaxID=46680 RepID=A0A7W7KNE6_PSENT|nr:ATPase, T2SS/T4P/T4SS family [Pseudomonas nitritireducens]MBB4865293.1 hypothetical protein [Pseudomonas nitritireducens]
MSDPLKIRAKRLRNAIEQELGIKPTLAKAYEILAKEDGFPNWDTASASHLNVPQVQGPTAASTAHDFIRLGEGFLTEVYCRPSRERLGLTVFAGTSHSKKDQMLERLVSERFTQTPSRMIYQVGEGDIQYPEGALVFRRDIEQAVPQYYNCVLLVVIPEIRSEAEAAVAYRSVQLGHDVLTTVTTDTMKGAHRRLERFIGEDLVLINPLNIVLVPYIDTLGFRVEQRLTPLTP